MDTLARTIYGEARGEGSTGMQAVANVVMNRVRYPLSWWGNTIVDVCKKPFQFSCWNTNDPNFILVSAARPGDATFDLAIEIACQAVKGTLPDITNGATHYHDVRMRQKPRWAIHLEPCKVIGHHAFYNDVQMGDKA